MSHNKRVSKQRISNTFDDSRRHLVINIIRVIEARWDSNLNKRDSINIITKICTIIFEKSHGICNDIHDVVTRCVTSSSSDQGGVFFKKKKKNRPIFVELNCVDGL